MAEIDDLKMILRNADISCITDAKTFQEQKVRFGECIIFVSSLERREAEIRAKAIDEFAEKLGHKILFELDDCAEELDWIEEIAWQLKAGE